MWTRLSGNGFFVGSIHPMTEAMGFLEPRIIKISDFKSREKSVQIITYILIKVILNDILVEDLCYPPP